jgi:hypothetical protein
MRRTLERWVVPAAFAALFLATVEAGSRGQSAGAERRRDRAPAAVMATRAGQDPGRAARRQMALQAARALRPLPATEGVRDPRVVGDPPPLPSVADIVAAVKARGDLTIDLAADAGALPGPTYADRTRTALQNAVAAAKTDPSGAGLRTNDGARVTIHLPRAAAGWYLSREVWVEQPAIDIKGDGWASLVILDPYRHGPALIFGISRAPLGVPLDPARFAPLPGVPGRWTFRADLGAWLVQRGGVLDMGVDFWNGSSFTVEHDFIIDSTGHLYTGPLCGMSAYGGLPSPWRLNVGAGLLFGYDRIVNLEMVVRDPARSPSDVGPLSQSVDQRSVWIPAPTGAGRHRVTFQVDLAAGTVQAYVDGTRVQVRAWTGSAIVNVAGLRSPGYTAGPPLRLAGNENAPFLVGAESSKGNGGGREYGPVEAGYALTTVGVRVSSGPVYAAGTVGGAATLLAGKSDDIFTNNDNTIAYLTMDRDPALAAPERSTDVMCGPFAGFVNRGSVLAISSEHSAPNAAFGGHVLADFAVSAQPGVLPYGSAIALGYATYVSMRGVNFAGGSFGVGDQNFGANYTIDINDSWLYGGDAAIWGHTMIVRGNRLQHFAIGRTLYRFLGSAATLRDVFVAPTGAPEYIARLTANTDFFWQGGQIDIEGGVYPSVGGVYGETGADSPMGGRIYLGYIAAGLFPPPGKPLAILRTPPNANVGRFDFEGWTLFPAGQSAVVNVQGNAQGTNWRGKVRLDHSLPGVPPVFQVRPFGARIAVEVP